MSDHVDPAIEDPDDLIGLGLQVAFQAKLDARAALDRGPVISRIEGEGHTIESVLLPPSGSPQTAEKGSPAPCELPRGIGKYQVLEELGRGGLGVVVRARDTDLGRDTAMKVLLRQRKHSAQALQRFVEEAQVAGQLQHPGIVPVYEMGTLLDASPYFTMQLVNGRTLAVLLKDRRGAADERLRFLGIFEQVCQAMAYAHSRGVIHRDLKPSNVMVGRYGEVQVMDWGLSKVLAKAGAGDAAFADPAAPGVQTLRSLGSGPDSLHGTVMGTPAYMSPEQARGDVSVIDERSDVFSLGAILCEILSGAPPYVGDSTEQLIQHALSAALEPAWRRLEAAGVENDLVHIARSCLAAFPADRPRDAGSVAAKLRAYLTSIEERARASELARVRALASAASERKARRLTLALASCILLALGIGGSAYLLIESGRRQREATTAGAIEDAVAESTMLLGQARAAPPEENSKWNEALQAAKRASALAASGDANDSARARVTGLIEEIQAGAQSARTVAEKRRLDRRMLDRLEEIRLSRADPGMANWKQQDEEYSAAFQAYGIDVEGASVEAIAAVTRGSPIRAELTAGLDEWELARRKRDDLPRGSWSALSRIAAAADTDDLMVRLRELAHEGRFEELQALARDPAVSELSASGACQLAEWLYSPQDPGSAFAVCRTALAKYPQDFWLNTTLGIWLLQAKPPDARTSSRYLTAAVALRPTASRAWNNLGCALSRLQEPVEATAAYRQALRLDPRSYHALNNLGSMLIESGELHEALHVLGEAVQVGREYPEAPANLGRALESMGCLREAVETYRAASKLGSPRGGSLNRVGQLLEDQEDFDGAVDAYRAWIEEEPGSAEAHLALGTALARQQKLDIGIPVLLEAIRLDPMLASAHANLGTALLVRGDFEGSAAALRDAVRVDPNYAQAYSNLSAVCDRLGNTEEALEACREAVRLEPKRAQAHFNLGVCLERTGDRNGALAAFQEAGRLRPNYGEAHLAHGQLLEQRGEYAEALESYRQAEAWSKQSAGNLSRYERRLRPCERRAKLASRLAELLKEPGQAEGSDCVELAKICHARGRYADAVHFWAAAFTARSEDRTSIEDEHRYAAACSAALASCAEGEQGGAPRDAATTKRLRHQALEWLRRDLDGIEQRSRSPGADLDALGKLLLECKRDPDLACVRDEEALAGFSEEERTAWRSLWSDLDRVLSRATPVR